MDTTFNAQDYLLKRGIKPSLQRIAIVEYLMENRVHPTADEIYNALCVKVPTLSKTMVYNTMRLFVEHSAVIPLVIDEKNVRFDIDISFHAHFLCVGCNKLFDLPVEKDEWFDIKQVRDFSVLETHLYYKGYCKTCKKIKQ